MRYSVFSAVIVALFWAALPLLVVRGDAAPESEPGVVSAAGTDSGAVSGHSGETTDSAALSIPDAQCFDASFRLPVLQDGQIESMALDRYLTGVLLAEMPASFADEARKAQAVASRTYALRSYRHRRHDGAAVCANAGCCQGWTDPDSVDLAVRAKAEEAVRATDGLVIRYEGTLIDATFFSCSGGQTEDAAAVWGSELPYLHAVESPGEEGAAHFTDETRIPLAELQAGLTELDAEVRFPDNPAEWIGPVSYTPGGGVDMIELGGRTFRGTQLRKRFRLRSTAFTLELKDGEAVFLTRGYGHRVGLSQYGADAMARAGNDFGTILKWYYQGVDIGPAEP